MKPDWDYHRELASLSSHMEKDGSVPSESLGTERKLCQRCNFELLLPLDQDFCEACLDDMDNSVTP